MALTAIIGIYNSRIILSTLGIEDFGIYSLIYGLVLLFSFMNGSMSGTVQRFFSVSIGKKDKDSLSEYIGSSILIHIALAILVLILGKTIGEWFLLNKLVVPELKRESGYWVYQITLISFLLQILSTPAQALLIAYEKMGTTALTNALSSLGKLISILIVLRVNPENGLVLFCTIGLAFSIIQVIIFFVASGILNNISFTCSIVKLKELSIFATWSFFGDLASVAKNQGSAIILNMFFGAPINAAYGISNQVCSNLNNLSGMVIRAANPQIIMLYNSSSKEKAYRLVAQLSKITFSLLFIISIPFLFLTQDILTLWLGNVPEYSVQFTQLAIVAALIEVCSLPLMVLSKATGKIKRYQIVVGGILLLNIPLAYLVLLTTRVPENVFYVFLFNSILAMVFRLSILRKTSGISIVYLIRQVYLKLLILTITTCSYAFLSYLIFKGYSTFTLINQGLILPVLSTFIIITFVLDKNEKTYITKLYSNFLIRYMKKDKL